MKKWLPLLVAAVWMSACSGDSGSGSGLVPTVVTGTPVTETFTGTVVPGGIDSHTFTVTLSDNVSVTLTAAGPPSTIFMGLGVGTPSGSNCLVPNGSAVAAQGGSTPQLAGTLQQGSYCVAVFDIGNESAPVTYTVTVTHT